MLDITLLPNQKEVFKAPDGVDFDIALYQGGFGSGKTFLGALIGLYTLWQSADMVQPTWLVGADSAIRLKLSTWNTYLELLHNAKIPFKANQSDRIITIPSWGNAKILFKGLEDPFSLRSINAIGGHLEEASLLSYASYEEFLGRLRQAKNGVPIRLVLTTNPQMQKGWLYDRFVTKAGTELIPVERAGSTMSVCHRRVIARTIDNPHLPDAQLATLQTTYDEATYRVLVLGEDGDYRAGLVCQSWSEANVAKLQYDPNRTLYLTCDFNIDPNCWAIAHLSGAIGSETQYHFIDEMCLENTTTHKASEEFYNRYKGHNGNIVLCGDASGQNRNSQATNALDNNYTILRNRLMELGFKKIDLSLNTRNPAVETRTQSWNGAVGNTVGVRRVLVDPKCKWLIYNCENLKYVAGSSLIWEPTAKQIEANPKLKFTKHIWDAASYLVQRFSPVEKPDFVKGKAIFSTAKFQPAR